MPAQRTRDKAIANTARLIIPDGAVPPLEDRREDAVTLPTDGPAIALYEADWGPGGWESLSPVVRNAWRRAALAGSADDTREA